jgi:hypothetical protein
VWRAVDWRRRRSFGNWGAGQGLRDQPPTARAGCRRRHRPGPAPARPSSSVRTWAGTGYLGQDLPRRELGNADVREGRRDRSRRSAIPSIQAFSSPWSAPRSPSASTGRSPLSCSVGTLSTAPSWKSAAWPRSFRIRFPLQAVHQDADGLPLLRRAVRSFGPLRNVPYPATSGRRMPPEAAGRSPSPDIRGPPAGTRRCPRSPRR